MISKAFAHKINAEIFGGQNYVPPATWYFGLSTPMGRFPLMANLLIPDILAPQSLITKLVLQNLLLVPLIL